MSSRKKLLQGIDTFDFSSLKGRRVAVIANYTSIDKNGVSLVEKMVNSGLNVTAIFSPEHGFFPVAQDMECVGTENKINGIPVFSLYGNSVGTLAPKDEYFDLFDIVVYDIQDIGCRSFTYISTMGMLMEACAQYGKELIVLDRPNPLGGLKIEGNLVEDGYISFVSQFKIPYVYGQTCGELALYLNAQTDKPCRLTVIPMDGWRRDMTWEETGLEWIVASPHIPQAKTAYFYPATGKIGRAHV